MEQNFQTSFIPKKPVVKERSTTSEPISPLIVIALLILFTVALAAGSIYFFKKLTEKQLDDMKENLKLAQADFETEKIADLQVLDRRLKASAEILSGHVAVTPLFKALQELTLKTVRFTEFNYELGEDRGAPIKIITSGQAVGYRSIALQSDLFIKNKSFIDPVFSNLSLDKNGNVLFDLEFSVEPSFLNYKQALLDS